MASTKITPSLTHSLLSRAHPPDEATRIFTDKIQHRPLLLRPSSPPPSSNARAQRRHARRVALQHRKKLAKPRPLTSRERRRLGLHEVSPQARKYAVFEPLNRLWTGYIHEILGKELYTGGSAAAAKLAAADYHGAEVEVVRSGCPSRVGIRGIVVRDTMFTFEIIDRRDRVKVVPKERSFFRIRVPVRGVGGGGMKRGEGTTTVEAAAGKGEETDVTAPDGGGRSKAEFVFELLGDQFQCRSADRASKKFAQHYLKML